MPYHDGTEYHSAEEHLCDHTSHKWRWWITTIVSRLHFHAPFNRWWLADGAPQRRESQKYLLFFSLIRHPFSNSSILRHCKANALLESCRYLLTARASEECSTDCKYHLETHSLLTRFLDFGVLVMRAIERSSRLSTWRPLLSALLRSFRSRPLSAQKKTEMVGTTKFLDTTKIIWRTRLTFSTISPPGSRRKRFARWIHSRFRAPKCSNIR